MALRLIRKSTGDTITDVRSLEHGLMAIMVNESEDKEIGCYVPDNYDILNEKGESIL